MKKTLSLLLAFMLLSAAAIAQDRNAVFDPQVPVTFLGLDFSNARLIGDREKLGSESDIRHLLDAWNEITLNEPDKYDVAAAIGRTKVDISLKAVEEHNAELEVLSLYSAEAKDYFHMKPENVRSIVASYDYKGMNGIGLMFVVESFSKLNVEAAIWVTFIDVKSKQVIFTERMTGKPGGFGMRNYWAGAIYDMLKHIGKKDFEMWKKKYYRS